MKWHQHCRSLKVCILLLFITCIHVPVCLQKDNCITLMYECIYSWVHQRQTREFTQGRLDNLDLSLLHIADIPILLVAFFLNISVYWVIMHVKPRRNEEGSYPYSLNFRTACNSRRYIRLFRLHVPELGPIGTQNTYFLLY